MNKKYLFIGLLAASVSAAHVSAAQNSDGLFGSLEIASDNLKALPQWSNAQNGFGELKKLAKACDQDILKCESQQMTLWRTKIQELEHADVTIKLRQINSFINKWQKTTDLEAYKQSDYWSTPMEFMTNGGDSEDFAIMKYISLKELGVKPSAMRIVVTNDVLRGVTHSILSVKLKSKTYILDSQNDTVLDEKLVTYYVPFYSVNETTRWAHIPSQFATKRDAEGAN